MHQAAAKPLYVPSLSCLVLDMATASDSYNISLSLNPVLHGTMASTAQTTWLRTAHIFTTSGSIV
jgi:hypothetical protein